MNFKILTFATNPKHYVLNILKSKLDITVLDKEHFDWEGKKSVPYVLQYLNCLPENDLVLIMDSFDVLPLNNCTQENLYKGILKYFDLNKVTFNAETQCFPDSSMAIKYPDSPGKWKYLNGGIMTGTVKKIKQLFEKVIKEKIEINQKNYSNIFLTTNLINLDYRCEVFQTLLAGPYPHHPNIDMNDFEFENKTVINSFFKTRPLLFHGNGSVNLAPLLPYVKTISN